MTYWHPSDSGPVQTQAELAAAKGLGRLWHSRTAPRPGEAWASGVDDWWTHAIDNDEEGIRILLDDPGDRPHLLVQVTSERDFRILGWTTVAEARAIGRWVDDVHAHVLPRERLRDVHLLLGEIDPRVN